MNKQLRRHYAVPGLFLAVIGLVFSFKAEARYYQQNNIDRLFEALDNVVRADELCEVGKHGMAKTKLRIASYRVRIVLADIRYTPGLGKAVEALTVTNEKIMDPYLTPREKVDVALDCLAVGMPVLIKEQAYFSGNTDATLQTFKLARLLTAAYVFSPVRSVLQGAKRFLSINNVGCPMTSAAYRKALEAVNVAIDKIDDHSLTPGEKEFFVLDCLNVAEKALRRL